MYENLNQWLCATKNGDEISVSSVLEFSDYTQITDGKGKPADAKTIKFLVMNILITYQKWEQISMSGDTITNTRKPGKSY
jgi:hypothetical protein